MDDHKKEAGIPCSHELVQTQAMSSQRKGQDTDTYWYDQVDENGTVVAKWIVKDSTSIYPPFGRSILAEKIADVQ